ncbi:NAD(P)-dependent oxidoreductase [Agromyces aerolatus]|uniref:NAD(P)-dependent oxidoreductase n=1 Tax=Agromyces sp. LY-1074 TaxID=3074080 RepID=UPI002863825B|nr:MULTISPECIES: NAD(P)-dependent oxidoreductase [unclassified Agromyces]MDR5701387.1 NAD(P)-dependent oxidoreductase [Agromyces sp. LY-1074]MDR5706824.1 NAD(P)-dependent oxidoreductase [Agromyces sp. LY-1358]
MTRARTTHPATASTVAVLGLGAMGLPMATRLATLFEVRGFDLDEARLAEASRAGVTPSPSARAAADDADVVLLAVRDGQQLEQALFGEEGVAEVVGRGATVVVTSTIGTAAIERVADRLQGLGVDLVDAPVSGGPTRAGAGDLLIVVGAAQAAYAKVEPVLDALASTLVVVGATPGQGQALKTVNQLLCGVHIAAAAEALALARALGLDPSRSLEALTSGAAASFMLADRGPRMLEALDDETPETRSRVDIFVKDLGIVRDAARAVGLATPVAAAAEQLYVLRAAQGAAAADDSTLVRTILPRVRGAGGAGASPA